MNLDLTNKNALVCGSTQGIGKAVAEELAQLGASVTLCARNEDKLKEVLNTLDTSKGQKHQYIQADFSNPNGLKAALENYFNAGNTIHILVNNTGGPPAGPANAAKVEEFTQAFSNHLICNHILMQACVEGMKADNYGRIINLISTSVKQPLPNLGVSNTVRGAVANWSKTLANELGQFNITVNNVLPGATNTVRLEAIINNKVQKTGQSYDEVATVMKNQVPMKRFAEASEVANTVAFLASPAAGYINGINIPVDGGRTSVL